MKAERHVLNTRKFSTLLWVFFKYKNMKLEYRIIKSEDHALHVMWEEGWMLSCIGEGKMYFTRPARKSKEEKRADHTPEYIEFRKLYPSDAGIYDSKLITKYNKLVAEWLHKQIIEAVTLYKKELEVKKQTKIANASTFLNQQRWMQNFKVTKGEPWKEWMDAMLKPLDATQIEKVLAISKEWKDKNPIKELTEWILQNMILKVTS